MLVAQSVDVPRPVPLRCRPHPSGQAPFALDDKAAEWRD